MKLLKENIIESLVYDYKDFIEHHFELNEDIDITEIDEDTYVMDFQIGENTYLLDIIDGNIVLVIDDEDHDISDPQLLYLYLSNDNPRYIKNKMHFGDRIPSDIPSRMSNATIDLYNQKMVENLLNRIKGKLLSENMFKPRNLEGREEQYRKILNKECLAPTLTTISFPSSVPSHTRAPSFPTFLPVPSSTAVTVNDTSINGLSFNHATERLHSYPASGSLIIMPS